MGLSKSISYVINWQNLFHLFSFKNITSGDRFLLKTFFLTSTFFSKILPSFWQILYLQNKFRLDYTAQSGSHFSHNKLLILQCTHLKFRFSEKAIKTWKNLPLVLTFISKLQKKWDIFSNIVTFSQYLNFTMIFFATGHGASVQQGLDVIARQGRFVVFSVFNGDVLADWSLIGKCKM